MPESLSILFDRIRWEEKTLQDKAKEKGIDVKLIDAKALPIDLTSDNLGNFGDVVLQRCVGYFRGLHFAAILESKNKPVINSFRVDNFFIFVN